MKAKVWRKALKMSAIQGVKAFSFLAGEWPKTGKKRLSCQAILARVWPAGFFVCRFSDRHDLLAKSYPCFLARSEGFRF